MMALKHIRGLDFFLRRNSLFALVLTIAFSAVFIVGAPSANDHTPLRPVTPNFAVAPQLQVSDIQRAAQSGYTLIINNRPDGEGGPDQPTSAALARAAKKAGIDYIHVPFRSGHVTKDALAQMKVVFETRQDKTLAFCRSGTRAITIWAMAQSALGNMPPQEIITAAKSAGYDLRHQRDRLNVLAAEHNRAN